MRTFQSTTDFSEGGATTTSGGLVSLSDASTQYQGFWVGRLSNDSHASIPRVGAYNLTQRASQGPPTVVLSELSPHSEEQGDIGLLARDVYVEQASMLPPPVRKLGYPPAAAHVSRVSTRVRRVSSPLVSPFEDPFDPYRTGGPASPSSPTANSDVSRTRHSTHSWRSTDRISDPPQYAEYS